MGPARPTAGRPLAARPPGRRGGLTAPADPPAITVAASGVASGRPDLVLLTLGVETSAATPGEAMRLAASAAARLDELCAERGIDEADRQTVHVGVQPVFDHERQVVSAHQASYVLRLSVRDLGAAGDVVDAVSADDTVGRALRVQELALSFKDPEPLLATARAQAVAAARRRAEQLAQAAGVRLGPLRSLSEGAGDMPYDAPAWGRPTLVAQTTLPLQPGTQDLTVRVVASYDVEA